MPNTTVYTNNQYYQDIATAIRNKNGQSTLYKPSEMAPAIDSLVVSGQQVTLQNKTVTPTTSAQTITKDAGYTGLGTVTVNAIPSQYIVPTGTMTITNNGTYTVKWYASVDVDVDAGDVINNQSKTVEPTETRQYITYDDDYTGLEQVTVEPISNTYIGSGISRRSATDLTVSGATVSVPAGYYSATASKSVATATQAVPAITVSTTGLITATATQTGGYVSGGTKTTTYQLSAQSATTITPTESEQTAVAAGKYTTGAITVAAIPNSYVGSGITTRSAADLTISNNNVTVPAGYYASNATATITQYDLITPTVVLTNSTGVIQSTATITAGKSGYYASQFVTKTLSLTTQAETTITPTESTQTAVAPYRWTTGAITVAAVPTDTNNSFSANGTYTPESGKWFSSVTVDVPSDINNQAKTATPTTATQTIKPDSNYSGLSQVTINPIPSNYITTGDANATASEILNSKTVYVKGLKVTGTMPNNGATGGTITTQGGKYTIPAGYTSGGTVTASLPVSTITNGVLNVATITEATNDYGVEASITIPAGYYNTTTLSRVLSNVLPMTTSAITESQMLSGYEAYDYQGKLLTGTMTNRSAWNAILNETITSTTIPAGYHNGSGTVSHTTVNIPDPIFSIDNSTGVITASGTWTKGFTTDNSYSNTYTLPVLSINTATTSAGSLHDTIRATSNMTYVNISQGYNTTAQYIRVWAYNQSKTVTPSETSQTVSADSGYSGLGTVTVNAIPSEYVIPTLQSKTVTPSASQQSVGADSGYTGLKTVTVEAIPVITNSDLIITIGNNSFYTENGVRKYKETPSVTGTKAGYMYFNNGSAKNGTDKIYSAIASGTTVTPTKSSQSIGGSLTMLEGPITVAPIPDEYIIPTLQSKSVTPTESAQTVTPDTGYDGLSQVSVRAISSTYVGSGVTKKAAATITPGTSNQTIAAGTYLTGAQTIAGDADLVAGNIRSGVNIFGVNGSFTSDATAGPTEIFNGVTAYVDGELVTGTAVINKYYTGSSAPSSSLGNNGDIYLQQ